MKGSSDYSLFATGVCANISINADYLIILLMLAATESFLISAAAHLCDQLLSKNGH
jgi:hypothetical protein